MKINSTSTVNKLFGLIIAATVTCFLWTGCASKARRVSKASDSSITRLVSPHVARASGNDGNMVALMHQGKIIYVNENAVEACLAQGDTFAINEKGKSFYGNDQQLKRYLK